ncbi:MAG: CBS domain-containing protein [Acidimicrobiales bacterium]|jgi:CBS domain-containing protein|nr:CBS domain-containing protein [Acidimicrobiales bacterium]
MPRDLPVREVMTTGVLSFTPDQNVRDAMALLLERNVDAGPVVDADGAVVGMLSTGDLILQEAELHYPTVIAFLGATLESPKEKRRFDEELAKALGATVAEVMTRDVVSIGPDETVERAATLMHDEDASRLPVVDGDRLVGIIARGDIVRMILADDLAQADATRAEEQAFEELAGEDDEA